MDTFTVDRDAVINLLNEGYAVSAALEDHAGICPTHQTKDLRTALDEVAVALLGLPEDDGPLVELWEESERCAAKLWQS